MSERRRGYSLKAQLFNRPILDQLNHAVLPPIETHDQEASNIELGLLPGQDPTSSIRSHTSYSSHIYEPQSHQLQDNNPHDLASSSTSADHEKQDQQINQNISRFDPQIKSYVGKRGRIQRKLVNFKNLIMNIRPYRKSENGRIIPISLTGDFDRNECPVLDSTPTDGRVLLKDQRYGKPYVNNVITSARYTPYSFVPRQLYAQFSKIANLYFLTVAILQMIPSWSTTGTYTTIVPLLIFITISILREGYDDWRRHLQDKKENNKFTKIVMDKKIQLPAYKDLTKDKRKSLYKLSTFSSQTSISRLDPDQHEDNQNEEFDFVDSTVDENALSQPNTFTKENYLKRLELKVSKIKWKDIQVGDIIKLEQDESVPADILLLTSDGQNENEVFVETMDLDGETNLKSRIPQRKVSEKVNDALGLKNFKARVTTEDPNNDLYNFEGNVVLDGSTYPIGPENVIYRGSIIRNTNNLIGLVIFTGEESKIRMNAIKNPRTKAPKLQRYINMIVGFMVFVVLSLSLFSFMGQKLYYNRNKDTAWYLQSQTAGDAATVMSFIIMYNTLIPLSLYVTTEIIKVIQALFMHWDIDMYHQLSDTPCEARTATILEELGQVSYIFTDKTGTLTDNLMIFRKFSVAGAAWTHEIDNTANTDGIHAEDDEMEGSHGQPSRHSIDIRRSNTVYSGRPSLSASLISKKASLGRQGDSTGSPKTTLELLEHIQLNPNTIFSKKAKFFILSLALCHTCLPKTISEEDEEIEYQASSPDELALVVAARDMGFVVYNKSHKNLTIRTYPNGFNEEPVDEVYQILDVVEFTSARKRMSIIIKFPNDRICLLCKGADNIIIERLRNPQLAETKKNEVFRSTSMRKAHEAQVILQQRRSIDTNVGRKSIQLARPSLSPGPVAGSPDPNVGSIDELLQNIQRDQEEVDDVRLESKKSLHLQQRQKYNISQKDDRFDNDNLVSNEGYVLERTLEHIDDFSSEGLRTLLYGYRWLDKQEYEDWSLEYASAKTSLTDRSKKIEEVGCKLESNLELAGATAIEDKLQDGVSITIEKLRRSGIKLWMLTGDKRETAINIGYSCKLIKDYSTVVILDSKDEDLTAKMTAADLEIKAGNVAHCVVVIDGATLSEFEADSSMLSIFIELCTKTDSVVVCRASPSQKALMVTNVRNLYKNKVTLAIGDGANDIAMIQSADIGIGITGKEGLQAARSSDYSIAQFRYLQKLLLVHGRYNYIRTCKFVLSTFYKELFFYLTQVIFQRNAMFTGTSLYEPWSLSMFNTLFTSLPVLCIGMFEKDLKPATLLAVPELYSKGRLNEAFNLQIFVGWMLVGATEALLITFTSWQIWGFTALMDNTLYPCGVLTFTAIICTINIKVQFLEMHNRTILNVISFCLSCGGWFVWCCLLPGIYQEKTSKIYDVLVGLYQHFGRDITWWASLLILVTMPITYDIILQVFRNWFFATDSDVFRVLEKNSEIRKKIEYEAYDQMKQGWDWEKDPSKLKKLVPGAISNIHPGRKRKNTVTLDTELPPGSPSKIIHNTSFLTNDDEFETEVLPSGKLVKRRVKDGKIQKIGKKLRFAKQDEYAKETDDDVEAIIEQRMRGLE